MVLSARYQRAHSDKTKGLFRIAIHHALCNDRGDQMGTWLGLGWLPKFAKTK
jgi:hypothetical protein